MLKRLTALFLSVCLSGATGLAAAEEVALDSAFGSGGLVTTELGAGIDTATSIAVQDDGRIIVAGSSDNGLGSKMAVVRYLPDGSIDHEFSFSMGGSLGTVYGDDAVQAVVLRDDGQILLGGTLTVDGVRQGAVVSLLSYGQLDVNFGVGGIASINVGDLDSEIYDVIVDAAGRIVVTGFVADGMTENPFIARFNGNGEPDSGFQEAGTLIDTLVEGRGTGLAESADGSVIVGGYSIRDGEWKGLYLGRYLENGDPDDQFGDGGRSVWFDDVEQIAVHDIALSADEKIILAGDVETADGRQRIMLARYGKEGQPDPGFGENGILVYDSGMDSSVNSLVVNADSTIIAAGYQTSATGKDMLIIRYLPGAEAEEAVDTIESAADTDMPEDEPVEIFRISALSIEEGPLNIPVADQLVRTPEADLITTELAGSDEVGNAVLMTEDGSIYTAGYSGDDDNSAFMVARYSGL
ncbi:MAG: delta-60 repeat domain-containing protein, partial [Desulfocapsaceae bacterium]|nr:delta-60 repeat domain-containing protein [Desulfocapsaceae bacterium]